MSVLGNTFSNSSAQQIILGNVIGRVTSGRVGNASPFPEPQEKQEEPEPVPVTSPAERREEVAVLARTMTSQSVPRAPSEYRRSVHSPQVERTKTMDSIDSEHIHRTTTEQSAAIDHRLFEYEPESDLDPYSPIFDARKWTRALAKLNSSAMPSRIAGVSFSNLSIHGYGSDAGASYRVVLTSRTHVCRLPEDGHECALGLDQLREDHVDGKQETGPDFERIGWRARSWGDACRAWSSWKVRNEMCGRLLLSGCTTLLKTIAGEMNGIFIDEDSRINYRGEPLK